MLFYHKEEALINTNPGNAAIVRAARHYIYILTYKTYAYVSNV